MKHYTFLFESFTSHSQSYFYIILYSFKCNSNPVEETIIMNERKMDIKVKLFNWNAARAHINETDDYSHLNLHWNHVSLLDIFARKQKKMINKSMYKFNVCLFEFMHEHRTLCRSVMHSFFVEICMCGIILSASHHRCKIKIWYIKIRSRKHTLLLVSACRCVCVLVCSQSGRH